MYFILIRKSWYVSAIDIHEDKGDSEDPLAMGICYENTVLYFIFFILFLLVVIFIRKFPICFIMFSLLNRQTIQKAILFQLHIHNMYNSPNDLQYIYLVGRRVSEWNICSIVQGFFFALSIINQFLFFCLVNFRL